MWCVPGMSGTHARHSFVASLWACEWVCVGVVSGGEGGVGVDDRESDGARRRVWLRLRCWCCCEDPGTGIGADDDAGACTCAW